MAIGRTNAKASAGGEPIPAWKDPLWVDIEKLYDDDYRVAGWSQLYNYRTFCLIAASDNSTVFPAGFDYQTSDGVWYTGGTGGTHTWDKTKDFYDSLGVPYRWIAYYTNNIKTGFGATFPNFNLKLLWVVFGNQISNVLAGNSSLNTTAGFSFNRSLKSFQIKISLAFGLGEYTFFVCDNLTNFENFNHNPITVGTSTFEYTMLNSVITENLGSGSYRNIDGLKKVTINNVSVAYNQSLLNARNLENVELPNAFNSSIDISSSIMFSAFVLIDIINKLADRTATTSLTITMGATNLAKLTAEQIAVATARNWTLS